MVAARLPSFSQSTRRLGLATPSLTCSLVVAWHPSQDELGKLLLERAQVGQDELGHDGVGVASGVNEVARATDLAHDAERGSYDEGQRTTSQMASDKPLADVGQNWLPETLALVGTLDQASDVDELNRCRHDAAGFTMSASCSAGASSGTSTMPTLGSMVVKRVVGRKDRPFLVS